MWEKFENNMVYELVICIHQILTFSTYFNKTRYFDSGCMTVAQALQQVRKIVMVLGYSG